MAEKFTNTELLKILEECVYKVFSEKEKMKEAIENISPSAQSWNTESLQQYKELLEEYTTVISKWIALEEVSTNEAENNLEWYTLNYCHLALKMRDATADLNIFQQNFVHETVDENIYDYKEDSDDSEQCLMNESERDNEFYS